MKARAAFVVGVVLLWAFGASAAIPEVVAKRELLVKLSDSGRKSAQEVLALHLQAGGVARSGFRLFRQFQIVRLPAGIDLKVSRAVYARSPLVDYVEPNITYRAFDVVKDPLFGRQWSLSNTAQTGGEAGADIDALRAWEISRGSRKVVVAVIDTGIDYTHPDLAANAWRNPGEVQDGVDNDGNGYIDDLYGWNFYSQKSDPKDDHGHGSHCAGVIGAAHDSQGIMGIAADVRIMAVKFLGAAGNGTLEAGILATEYAIQNGADILSNSWGGDGFSKAFEEVIEEANRRGIVYVAAAGNDHSNNDTEPTYPAAYRNANVISVAATDHKDEKAFFTNWGKTSVHLAAPGVKILSSVLAGKYHVYSGTSMACPHVAGAAAVLKAHLPELSNVGIKDRLLSTVDRRFDLEGWVASGGRLNLYNALVNSSPPPVPDPVEWVEVPYRLSSPHDYPPLANFKWTIRHPGAKALKLHFTRLVTETRTDFVGLEAPDGRTIEALDGNQGELWSRTIPGDTVTIVLRSDSVNEFYGFDIDRYVIQP